MRFRLFSVAILCFSLMQTALSAGAETLPAWVNNPYAVCSEKSFCATGFGESLTLAKADARAGIGKIFETKIRSSFSSFLSQEDGEVKSSDREVILEETDAFMTAVDIKETYSSQAGVYALAELDKTLAASLLKEEISKLDEKIEILLSDTEPSSVRKAEKLYEKRLSLNQRYIILTGRPMLEFVSYKDIFKTKKAAIAHQNIFLSFQGEQDAATENTVKKIFIDNGYVLEKSPSAENRHIVFEIKSKKVPISVNKFEKYIFYFSIKQTDNAKTEKEILSTAVEAVELSKEQALQTALDEFEVFFQEHLDDFNL
jgi:hypothetical protein